MNKRALLLSAAAFALLSGPAFAATCDGPSTNATLCDIKSAVTTPLATSTVQAVPSDITIEGTGAINVTTATAPALTINSDNNVTNDGTISNKNTTGAIGVEMFAGHDTSTTTVATYDGELFDGTGTTTVSIDLSGSGTGKTGFILAPVSLLGTGTIDATGATLPTNSGILPGVNIGSMNVVGDGSYGVHLISGVTLKGDLNLDGVVTVKSSTTTAGTSTGVVGAELDGNLVGNFNIGAQTLFGGSVIATGAGSTGVDVLGSIDGSINVYGGATDANSNPLPTVAAYGSTATSTSTTGNPQGGAAFVLANSVTHGIYIGGPASNADTAAAAQIFSQGTGPAFLISSTQSSLTAPLNIGLYTNPDGSVPDDAGYDFYNRGQISSQPPNVDVTGVTGMEIVGSAGAPVIFQGGTIASDPMATEYTGGILNSGLISATGVSDTNDSSGVAATGLWIGTDATVPLLNNTSEVGPGHGNILATVSGASPGQAIAILINCTGTASCNPATDSYGTLNKLVNSGTIAASATSTDVKTAFLTAIAIDDKSGTLSDIENSGTIRATACATPVAGTCVNLDNYTAQNRTQTYTAAYLQNNTSGVMFNNSGTVIGDIFFGSGDDTLNLTGNGATVTGNISFDGGHDTLNIGDGDTVSGAVLERGGGYVDVTVGTDAGGTGWLYVNNTDFASSRDVSSNYANGTLQVGSLEVKSGATLGVSLSQGFNLAANSDNPYLIEAVEPGNTGKIQLDNGAKLDISFGSFVSTPGGDPAKFVLFDAPDIIIGNSSTITSSVEASIPFLFTGPSSGPILCGYGVDGFDSCGGTTPTDKQLVINLVPKTADDLQLSGYAKQIFPYANTALANDDTLGATIIAAGSGLTSSAADVATGDQLYQNIYSQFAPDVSGGSRAIAVSLTDEATSVIGAHQRELRMYAGKESAATLWGQEFVQRLDNGTNTPNGFRDSGFGFALGADGGSPSSGRYGAALTFFSGDILEKIPAQVKTSTEWYMLSGYTDWRGKGLFFDSQVTVGYGSLSGRRDIFVDNKDGLTLLERSATNKRSSLLGAAGFSTGAVMNMGTLVIMPQLSMDALTLRENGYTETGGGDGFDLQVDPYYAKSLRSYLGSSFREDLNVGGFYLQPEVRVGYRYDFLADPVNLKARFAADPTNSVTAGDPFTLTGPAPAKGSLVLGAGFAATTASWSLGLNYDFLNGGGLTQHTGMLTLVGRL